MQDLVVAGDIHLCNNIWASRPEIHGDAYRSFDQIIDYTVNNRCNLLLAGDIENTTKPSSMDVRVFRSGIERVNKEGLEIYAIRGNHDFADPPWFIASNDFVQHVNNQTFYPFGEQGPSFYGLDYRRKSQFPEVLSTIPSNTNALVMHNMLKEAFSIDGSYDFSISELPSFIKYLIMSHLHQDFDKTLSGIRAMYTSDTYCGKKGGDNHVHSFLRISCTDTDLEINRETLSTRNIFEFMINSDADTNRLYECLKDADIDPEFKPIVFIDFDAIKISEDTILKAVGGKAHVFTTPFSSEVSASRDTDISTDVIECLGKCIDRTLPSFDVLHSAISKGIEDPRQYFQELRKQWGL